MKNAPVLVLLFAALCSMPPARAGGAPAAEKRDRGAPLLYRAVAMPREFLSEFEGKPFGGDVRIGDLTGDGRVDFLVYRSVDDAHDGGGMKPCFLGAFAIDGRPLWRRGGGGRQPSRPGPVTACDLDGDGAAEIICLFHDPSVTSSPECMKDVVIQVRDGRDGAVKRSAAPPELTRCRGRGPNWVHQRLLVAGFRGGERPGDFVIKLGQDVIAFDANLKILWTYRCPWTAYSRCPACIPCAGDIDGDGRDEVNGGYFLLDDDGTVLWERQLGRHMDSVAIDRWDDGTMRAFCSGFGHVMDAAGKAVLKLGKEIVPHGQELRVARFDAAVPGPQMVIRHEGHTPRAILVGVDGTVIRTLTLNASPNNTGMEAVLWNGPGKPSVLYNGGVLWRDGCRKPVKLPGLPPPSGNPRQGWYHCVPADVCGDRREEVIVYNPWDTKVFIYTPHPAAGNYAGYRAGPRQYNARLMD